MGLVGNECLKGVRDVDFKYGGPSVEMSAMLHRLGLLSMEKIEVEGQKVVPRSVVLRQMPRPPLFPNEIEAVIKSGVECDTGALLVRVCGSSSTSSDGRTVRIDSYIESPDLEESFAAAQMTHEAYATGQCAAVFAQMMVDGICSEKGLLFPEQLNSECRRYVIQSLHHLRITVDQTVTEV